jgi:hypothetical protein
MNVSQIPGWQNPCRGRQKLIVKTRYREDLEFKAAVDYLIASKLNFKDIRRVAIMASTIKQRGHSCGLIDES